MRSENRSLLPWRMGTVAASLVAVVSLVTWLANSGHLGPGYLILCSVPLLVGLSAGLGPMETRTRILFLWLAALTSGFVGVITIMSGAGFVLLVMLVVYLAIAWMMNEAST